MRIAAALLLLPLFFGQEIAWRKDWKGTLKEAATSKKLVVLVFFNKGVKNCVRYQEVTLADAGVVAALGKYLCVQIDPDGTDDENRLWQEHKEPSLPMTFIYEPTGKQLAVVGSLNPKIYGGMLAAIVPTYFDKIVPAREALAKDPNQPDRHATLGEAFITLDNPPDSSKHYASAVDLLAGKGDKAGALKLLGVQLEKYYEKKWYSPARGCCGKLAELDPSNETKLRPMAAWMLGMASCDEGRWAEAIDGLKAACEKYKGDELQPKMMFTMASAYMYAKDVDNAITVFETIVKDYPGTETAEISQVQADKLRAQRQRQNEDK